MVSSSNFFTTLFKIFTEHVGPKLVTTFAFLIISNNQPAMLISFLSLFLIDTLLGVIRAIKQKEFTSSGFRKRIINKALAYMLALITANLLVGVDPLFSPFRRVLIFYLAAAEGISILENLKTFVGSKVKLNTLIGYLLSCIKEKPHA